MIEKKFSKLLKTIEPDQKVKISGFIRTRRDAKGFSFLEISDGSSLQNLQVIVNSASKGYDGLKNMSTGASVQITGDIVLSSGQGQKYELIAEEIVILGEADPNVYPLQKKRHSDEFLRKIAHLRPRTNKYGAIFRLRSHLAQRVHDFFKEKDFFWIHTPILTGSDCEGAGELFEVSRPGSSPFFGKPVYLTVSGQLPAEAMAMGLGRVYTFGPTFRAEKSDTPRHAAEFWMVEAEMAFADLEDDMDLAEDFLRFLFKAALEECSEEIALFDRFVHKGLVIELEKMASESFERITHSQAVEILFKAKRKFQFPLSEEMDLQTEHERFLAEEYFKKPVIIRDYPKDIKAFYMRLNDDGRSVAAMDVLTPRIGEIIGGSQREDRLEVLEARMMEKGLPIDEYQWYLDLRRFGTVPHAGFGLGFERLIMLVTGAANIRDVIPFPRTYGSIDF